MLADFAVTPRIKRFSVIKEFDLVEVELALRSKSHTAAGIVSRYDAIKRIYSVPDHVFHIFQIANAEQVARFGLVQLSNGPIKNPGRHDFALTQITANPKAVEPQRVDVLSRLDPQVFELRALRNPEQGLIGFFGFNTNLGPG